MRTTTARFPKASFHNRGADRPAATDHRHAAQALHRDDIPLAGYLLARQADGRPVKGADLMLLRDAHASVREARQLLPLGRGNVKEDLEATHGLSGLASLHVRELQDATTQPEVAALIMGAGLCDEYALLSGLSLAARMDKDVRARVARSTGIRHGWTEAARKGKLDDRAHTVVLDAWCSGPAVFAPDSTFGSATAFVEKSRAFGLQHFTKMEHGQRLEESRAEARALDFFAPELPPSWELDTEAPTWFSLQSTVHSNFASRARAKLKKKVTPEQAHAKAPAGPDVDPTVCETGRQGIPAGVRTAIQAVGIARHLVPDMSVKELARAASQIAHVATNLDRAGPPGIAPARSRCP